MSEVRIGITGGRGVLARSLQTTWSEAEWISFPGDIRNLSEVMDWVQAAGPLNALIHCAAMVPTRKVEQQPHAAFQTNVAGTCNILEAVRLIPKGTSRPWVFVGSTSHVYATAQGHLSEDSPLVPVSLYGETKLQAETWGRIYETKYGVPVCIGRIFSYSSPLQPESYFIPSLISKISMAPDAAVLEIPGLHGTRDFSKAAQISNTIRFLFEKQYCGTINIGNGSAVKLLDLAHHIKNQLGRQDVEIRALDTGTAHLCADITKLRELGLNPKPSAESMIDEMISMRADQKS